MTSLILRRLVPAAAVLAVVLTLLGMLVTRVFGSGPLGRADAAVDRTLASDRTPTINTATHWVTFAAETLTVAALAAVLVVVLRLVLHRWRESIFMATAVVGEVLIFLAVTLLVDRRRPPVPQLDQAPPTSSFPSGHVAAAISLYGGIAVVAWRSVRRRALQVLASGLALVVPLAVAFARLYRGMHFPTDIIGGMLLGVSWLGVTASTLLPRPGRNR